MISVIVKSGDDLRQEQFATQLIKLFDDVFRKSGLPLWLRTYTVLGTSSEAGLIETVPDSISIHSLKERLNITSLRSYYTAVIDFNSIFIYVLICCNIKKGLW